MVGYALAAAPKEMDIPWHRVINSKGSISPRSSGEDIIFQQILLENEGVIFDESGRTDLESFGWNPKDDIIEE
jgi:methylated-DNA-protein-cysteine methyltransferase-like protein